MDPGYLKDGLGMTNPVFYKEYFVEISFKTHVIYKIINQPYFFENKV